jgi:streptogramin lyase
VESTQDVAAMTTDGVFTAYQSPSGDHSLGGSGLAVGRDQNVWFAESSHIASVTPGGTVTEYLYPSGQTDNTYPAVTLGSDGRIWFTELNGILGAINTSSHRISEYRLHVSECGLIYGLAAGGDGNLYAPCGSHAYRISTQGKILRHYKLPRGLPTATSSTMEAADGRVWISMYHEFGVIDVYSRDGEIVRVPSPFSQTFTSIAAGPDGNMWGMGDETVNIYLRSRLDVRPLHLTLNPNNSAVLRASYRGELSLSATSANPSVATVAPAKTLDDFVVTAIAKGKTTVTVQDPIGNSFVVPVTVR